MKRGAAEKRTLIERHRGSLAFSRAARALGLSRKNRHEQVQAPDQDRAAWKECIERVLTEFPCYGYRRVTAALTRAGNTVNRKKIMRIMRETGLKQKRRTYKPRTTDSRHQLRTFPNLVKELVPSYPHHIWAGDITYVRLPGGFCYAAMLIDLFTRKVVGFAVALSMDESLVTACLDMALRDGTPAFHHSDRGGQYCATEYVGKLEGLGIAVSMADTGVSVDNPYAESLNRTLKVEEVYLRDYRDFAEAKASIRSFIVDVYNTRRLHSSLGYLPPAEFEALWRDKQLQKTALAVPCTH